MNIEANQETAAKKTPGERLRLAREAKGMTQQNVADKLCLKLSTVRDIEADNAPAELASTFLRGYIRSYARLVQVPENELLPDLAQAALARTAIITPMQSYALGSRRSKRKRDGLLSIFTWLIIFVVVGLTVAWWWQNHKAAQAELTTSSRSVETGDATGQSVPLSTEQETSSTANTQPSVAAPAPSDTPATGEQAQSTNDTASSSVPSAEEKVAPSGTEPVTDSNSAQQAATTSPTLPEAATPATVKSDALSLQFQADCWLEVTDASGKKLFSGLQSKGASLNLNGKLPYRLKIGAPSVVAVQFRGQPVDLSSFVHRNQVARLSVGTP